MRIDRSHTPWILFVLAATVGATVLFLANFYPQSLPFAFELPAIFGEVPPLRRTFGGTPLGLLFGTIAFLIFLFAAALGIRKKRRLWPIGSVQFWLRAHIWLTILTIPLVLYHCGFHFGGTHTSWLMTLYIFVMGSGFFGMLLQHYMPRIMKRRIPREVVFEQIDHVRSTIFESALQLRNEFKEAAKAVLPKASAGNVEVIENADYSAQTLCVFLDEECLPYLHNSRRGRGRLGDEQTASDLFRLLKLNVSDKYVAKVNLMQTWCEDRRYMDIQVNLHHWLHGWLFIHIPTSFALLIFTAWHAWVAVRYLVVS